MWFATPMDGNPIQVETEAPTEITLPELGALDEYVYIQMTLPTTVKVNGEDVIGRVTYETTPDGWRKCGPIYSWLYRWVPHWLIRYWRVLRFGTA